MQARLIGRHLFRDVEYRNVGLLRGAGQHRYLRIGFRDDLVVRGHLRGPVDEL